MRFKISGYTKDVMGAAVRNVDTVAIKAGAPVFFKSAGTSFGLDAISAEGLAAANQILFVGIALAEIAVNGVGDAFAFGMFTTARYVYQTRSATNVSWAAASAVAIGDRLGIESDSSAEHPQAFKWLGNTLLASAASQASLASNVTIPSIASIASVENFGLEAQIRAAVSRASAATEASNSAAADAAQLFRTTTLSVFVRAL